jgi:7-cyano-7-deazaguanine synthase in queuosine biosynthesis
MLFEIEIPQKEQFVLDLSELKYHSNIGVMFSGGIDSTLILSALQKAKSKYRFNLTAYTVENNNGYDIHAKNILAMKFFEGITHVNNVSNFGRLDGTIRESISYVMNLPDLDLLYTGVNANPPTKIVGAPNRFSAEQIRQFTKLRCPFVELTKDYILQAYYQWDWLREFNILEKTHSCTNLKQGSCHKCFQCLEKEWAFNQINRNFI